MLRWACKWQYCFHHSSWSVELVLLLAQASKLQLSLTICPGSDQLQGSQKTHQIKKPWRRRWRRRTQRWTWCCSKCRWCCPTPVAALCCAIWVRMEAPPTAFASHWPASTSLHCWVSLSCSSSSSRSHHCQHFDSSAANLLWFEMGILECVVLLLICCGLRQEFWNVFWLRTVSVHPEMTVQLIGCKNLITCLLPVVMKHSSTMPHQISDVWNITGMCAFSSTSVSRHPVTLIQGWKGSTFNSNWLIDSWCLKQRSYEGEDQFTKLHVSDRCSCDCAERGCGKNEVDWTRMAEVTRQISWQGLKHATLYSGLLLALKRAPLIDLHSQQRWD